MNYPSASSGVSKFQRFGVPIAASCGEYDPKRFIFLNFVLFVSFVVKTIFSSLVAV
jgi:hypothetical protein